MYLKRSLSLLIGFSEQTKNVSGSVIVMITFTCSVLYTSGQAFSIFPLDKYFNLQRQKNSFTPLHKTVQAVIIVPSSVHCSQLKQDNQTSAPKQIVTRNVNPPNLKLHLLINRKSCKSNLKLTGINFPFAPVSFGGIAPS